jgi:hypothetical protein
MTENDLYSVTLCQEDWVRVVQALRNEAYALTQDSNRAHENGAIDYSTLLWEETAIHNDIADTIEWKLPD